MVESSQTDILESLVDKVTEFLSLYGRLNRCSYVLEIAIINELHEQEIIEEELSFRVLHDLICSEEGALELSLS